MRILISDEALAQIVALPESDRSQVKKKIDLLGRTWPRDAVPIHKLSGNPDLWILRAGKHRVAFRLETSGRTILVLDVYEPGH